jgi:hypothetical protein
MAAEKEAKGQPSGMTDANAPGSVRTALTQLATAEGEASVVEQALALPPALALTLPPLLALAPALAAPVLLAPPGVLVLVALAAADACAPAAWRGARTAFAGLCSMSAAGQVHGATV